MNRKTFTIHTCVIAISQKGTQNIVTNIKLNNHICILEVYYSNNKASYNYQYFVASVYRNKEKLHAHIDTTLIHGA